MSPETLAELVRQLLAASPESLPHLIELVDPTDREKVLAEALAQVREQMAERQAKRDELVKRLELLMATPHGEA